MTILTENTIDNFIPSSVTANAYDAAIPLSKNGFFNDVNRLAAFLSKAHIIFDVVRCESLFNFCDASKRLATTTCWIDNDEPSIFFICYIFQNQETVCLRGRKIKF